ncbi:MAG: class I SAM-dependent methyltransferase [Nanoarchaeota archaeon]|nr:class I SAM-dependent methyltransferase [Nanoarchaeota archaeon]
MKSEGGRRKITGEKGAHTVVKEEGKPNMYKNDDVVCPLCLSVDTTKIDYKDILPRLSKTTRFSNSKLDYWKCNTCDVEFNINPDYSELNELYKERYRPKKIGWMRRLRWLIPYSNYNKRNLDFLKPILNEKGSVLDIGSSNGKFLYLLRARGWKVFGVEPTKQYAEFANKFLRIKTFNGFFEDFKTDERFDLVTILLSLDHLRDPVSILKKIHLILNKGGHMFITLAINHPGYAMEHTFLFSEKSIYSLLEKTGFRVEKTIVYNEEAGNEIFVLARK